jgi:hypothetical protein
VAVALALDIVAMAATADKVVVVVVHPGEEVPV